MNERNKDTEIKITLPERNLGIVTKKFQSMRVTGSLNETPAHTALNLPRCY